MPAASPAFRPLLKWAGGKRQLLPLLRPLFPRDFRRYIEPFLGSGAVFFDLYATGRLAGRPAILVDDNVDLIGCYQRLRDDVDGVIDALERLEEGHRRGGPAHFYEVRDGRFNASRLKVLEQRSPEAYTAALAAMFIYLNRTGFNGLFRLNARGLFNVPAGRYANPRICDPDHLRKVAAAFRTRGVELGLGSYEETLARARAGDLIYCDPPYAPVSATARFTSYTAAGFGVREHRRLRECIVDAAERGAAVILSNSSAPLVIRLYDRREVRRAGLRLHRVPARRAINSRASSRGPIEELLITNLPA